MIGGNLKGGTAGGSKLYSTAEQPRTHVHAMSCVMPHEPATPAHTHCQCLQSQDIFVRTTGDSRSSRPADSGELQQPLSLAAAERANKEPGVKEQRLVTALWNLDRVDQQQLPLNRTFTYGTPSTPGTGQCNMS